MIVQVIFCVIIFAVLFIFLLVISKTLNNTINQLTKLEYIVSKEQEFTKEKIEIARELKEKAEKESEADAETKE